MNQICDVKNNKETANNNNQNKSFLYCISYRIPPLQSG